MLHEDDGAERTCPVPNEPQEVTESVIKSVLSDNGQRNDAERHVSKTIDVGGIKDVCSHSGC